MSEAMGHLFTQDDSLFLIKLWDLLNVMRTLGDQGALLQQREDVGQVVFFCELLDILEQLMLRNAYKRITNPVRSQLSYLCIIVWIRTLPWYYFRALLCSATC